MCEAIGPAWVTTTDSFGALHGDVTPASQHARTDMPSLPNLTRRYLAILAVAADTGLDGRVLVVEPRNAGAKVVSLAP